MKRLGRTGPEEDLDDEDFLDCAPSMPWVFRIGGYTAFLAALWGVLTLAGGCR